MKYFLTFIATVFIFISADVYALDPNNTPANDFKNCSIKEYNCYEQHVENICNAKDAPFNNLWGSGPDLGALKSIANIAYPELDKDKINNTIGSIEALEQSDPTALQDGVSMNSIGASNSFRVVELAALMYRRNMNSIFSCGIIASRSAKLDTLHSTLEGKQGGSEIQKSIEKERKRYETLKVQMSCDGNRPENSATGVVERVMKSSMKEYCRYTYYLDYVDANIRESFSRLSNIESSIGNGNTSKASATIDSAKRDFLTRGHLIEEERKRANEVLPKAIVAFQEMDRTYIVHIMLTFLYDDYLKLRGQLNNYLTQIGQTFEKAFNAQDDNQK